MISTKSLRFLAIAEGISYLLFGITMPLKYLAQIPEPNYVVGMAHGFLFVAYVGLVLILGFKQKWPTKWLLLSLLASIIPLGTFYVERSFFKKLI